MILLEGAFVSALIALVVTAAYYGGTRAEALWVSQALVLLSTTLAASALCNSQAARLARLPRRSEWGGAAALYAAFVLLGFARWVACVLTDGRWGTVNRQASLEALVSHLVFGAAVFAFTVTLSSRLHVRWVCAALAFFVLGSGALSFYLKINGLVGGTHNDVSDLAFFGANSNQYGGVLTLLTPLLLGVIVYRLARGGLLRGRRLDPEGLEALLWGATLALVTALIFWVEARGAFLMHMMLLAGCAALLIFRGSFKAVLLVLAAALAGVTIILNVLGWTQATEWFGRSIGESLSLRIHIQADVLRACLTKPWFGWGEGTLPWILRLFQSDRADLVYVLQSYNAHLTRWAESGLLGAALWYGAVLAWSVPSVVQAMRSPSLWSSCLGGASFVGILYLGFLCLSDDYAATPAVRLLLAFYLALLMRTRRPLPRSPGSESDVRQEEEEKKGADAGDRAGAKLWERVLPNLLVIVVAVVTAGAAYARYELYRQLHRAQARPLILSGLAFPLKDSEEVPRALRQASLAAPGSADPHALMGRYWQANASKRKNGTLRRTQLERALKSYRTAIALAPTWPDTYLHAASVCIALKRPDEAAALFLEGLERNPNARDPKLYALSQLLAQAERSRRPEERSMLRAACDRIVEGAARLERPFTIRDYGYILDYDHIAGKPRRLSVDGDRRVREYLSGLTRA